MTSSSTNRFKGANSGLEVRRVVWAYVTSVCVAAVSHWLISSAQGPRGSVCRLKQEGGKLPDPLQAGTIISVVMNFPRSMLRFFYTHRSEVKCCCLFVFHTPQVPAGYTGATSHPKAGPSDAAVQGPNSSIHALAANEWSRCC